ncbi:gluconolactonase [Mycobacterium colombiense]|nr:gluconolactonase [Mycobacterium colombiense]
MSPRWFEGLLWFSDLLGEAVHTVNLNGSLTTLPLAGHSPSGLAFRPDGSLLIASAAKRQLLRYDGDAITLVADVSEAAPADLRDMTIDDTGRAFVSSGAAVAGVIVRLDLDGQIAIVADELARPIGMDVMRDGKTLIVAEAAAQRLTAFTIAADGSLANRRVFAEGLAAPPEYLALDDAGGAWISMRGANQFHRVVAGGVVTDRIVTGERVTTACTLGGPNARTLFMLSDSRNNSGSNQATLSSLDALMVDIPAPRLR